MPAVSSGLPSLTDLKRRLDITSTTHDIELADSLDEAVRVLSVRLGYPLEAGTVTETHDSGGGVLLLRRVPVDSLDAVTYADGTAVDVADLLLDSWSGVVTWRYGTVGRFVGGVARWVTVTYSVTLPADLRRAVLELAAHLWETQRGNAPSPFTPTGEPDQQPASTGFLLPYRVQSLIEPYVQPVVA